jgi:hypothetical protein
VFANILDNLIGRLCLMAIAFVVALLVALLQVPPILLVAASLGLLTGRRDFAFQ